VIVGIGVNADWARSDFPPDIAHSMSSLREASGGRPIDRDGLLESFLDHLEGRLDALRAGYFDVAAWHRRQATTGRMVTLQSGDGSASEPMLAVGVDASSGALVLEDASASGGERHILAGEVIRVRLADAPPSSGEV
jgi:biotin-(acetyl-CoA carboxylase) ligase